MFVLFMCSSVHFVHAPLTRAQNRKKKKKKKKKKPPVFFFVAQSDVDSAMASQIDSTTSATTSFTTTSLTSSNSDAPKLTKTSWRGSQTVVLVDAVTVLGDCNWRQVAQYIPSKTAAQCAQQWAR
jgi:hypothetical protein